MTRRRPVAILEILTWLFVVFIPVTRFPAGFGPLLILLVCLPYFVLVVRGGVLPRPAAWLCAIAGYQLASALAFGAPPSNLLDFEFYRRDAKFLFAYAPFLVGATLGLTLPAVMRHLRVLVWVTTAVAAVGLGEYALALAGVSLHVFVSRGSDGLLYFSGLTTSHNAAGSIYAVVAAYTFGQLLAGGWRGRMPWVAAAVLSIAVVLTLSRSFLVAILVSFLGAILAWGNRRQLVTATVVAIVGLGLVGRDMVRRIVQLRNPTEVHNVVQRLVYWERAASYIGRSPWLGVGFSRFNDVPTRSFAGIRGVLQWKREAVVRSDDGHAHNALLMVWAETGLVGVLLWSGFLASLYRECRRRFRSALSPPELRGLAFGVTLAFAVVLVASLVAHNLVTPSAVWPAGFFAGAMLQLPALRAVPAPRDNRSGTVGATSSPSR